MTDKLKEHNRYEERARLTINSLGNTQSAFLNFESGSAAILLTLRTPYIYYEKRISEIIRSHMRVLEIGAGSGAHTGILIQTGANVIATDISQSSLELISFRYKSPKNLNTIVADMESLPFDNESFDVVTCAGSLSYGDNTSVMNEVFRVLRPDGFFVCVDSLNNNPIYKFNRWLHYFRGNRTKSTLQRMPTIRLIDQYRAFFGHVEVSFFGSISWSIPFLMRIFGEVHVRSFLDWMDRFIAVRASAFKFVMVAKKSDN